MFWSPIWRQILKSFLWTSAASLMSFTLTVLVWFFCLVVFIGWRLVAQATASSHSHINSSTALGAPPRPFRRAMAHVVPTARRGRAHAWGHGDKTWWTKG